ncbi:MAG TPA: ABC transporter permease [Candidatus Polarisedimenticolia bacterium]|jgi:predicted permease|nr:ABC transporter permease [Candidatus Polarisedimenticolia bacterium]
MDGIVADLRYALRTLAKNRGFALVAILTLALGIGANTAIYSLTDQILLRLLPVRDPDRLVVLRLPGPQAGHLWSDIDDGAQSFSYPFYKGLRDQSPLLSGLAARFAIPVSVADRDRTERASGELVSGNYFDVLGVRPALGRLLTPEDDRQPGANPVVVLSHGYWTRRFGASPAILNQGLVVNGRTLTVVGVARPPFSGIQLGQPADLFVPITLKAQMTPNWDGLDDINDYWLQAIGRLAPVVSREQAEASLQPIVNGLLEQQVQSLTGLTAEKRAHLLGRKLLLAPGAQGRLVLQDEARGGLFLLSALVGLVLLIACANVANLLIARGVARRREIAVRLALGARRIHLMRQLLSESLLLALAGGAIGLLVAAWSIDSILLMFPQDDGTAALSSHLDLRLLAFNFGVALLTGLGFGLLPALRATRPDLVSAIKDQSAGAGTGAGHVRLRKGLVVAQISLTAVLLITAGLFTQSLRRLKQVDLGLSIDNLLAASIEPQLNGYTPERTIALVDRMSRDLAALPGVTSVSAAKIALLTDSNEGSNGTIEGLTPQENESFHPLKNWVGPGYFATLGIPLLAGREFSESDSAGSPKVAVINQTMARKFFAGRDPIGVRFAFGAGNGVKPDIEIVGVVRNSKHSTVRQEERPFVCMPYAQHPGLGEATFYLRSALPATTLAPAVREAVRRIDANLPVFDVRTLALQLDQSLYGERLLMALSISFGLLAALLASIGLYGMMAYSVARRTSEIGLRMALGASARHVRGLVLREAMTMAAIGLSIGLPAAFAAGRLARSLLFGVEPGDPLLLAAAGLLLIGVMLLASYVPARRATRIDPMAALRSE